MDNRYNNFIANPQDQQRQQSQPQPFPNQQFQQSFTPQPLPPLINQQIPLLQQISKNSQPQVQSDIPQQQNLFPYSYSMPNIPSQQVPFNNLNPNPNMDPNQSQSQTQNQQVPLIPSNQINSQQQLLYNQQMQFNHFSQQIQNDYFQLQHQQHQQFQIQQFQNQQQQQLPQNFPPQQPHPNLPILHQQIQDQNPNQNPNQNSNQNQNQFFTNITDKAPKRTQSVSKHKNNKKVSAFVTKLYTMLHDQTLSHLIWWSRLYQNDHHTFALLPGSEFATCLTTYFKHGNVASFVRQLHMYGFHKVCEANQNNPNSNLPNTTVWEFRHNSKTFRRGDSSNLHLIKRRTNSRRSSANDTTTINNDETINEKIHTNISNIDTDNDNDNDDNDYNANNKDDITSNNIKNEQSLTDINNITKLPSNDNVKIETITKTDFNNDMNKLNKTEIKLEGDSEKKYNDKLSLNSNRIVYNPVYFTSKDNSKENSLLENTQTIKEENENGDENGHENEHEQQNKNENENDNNHMSIIRTTTPKPNRLLNRHMSQVSPSQQTNQPHIPLSMNNINNNIDQQLQSTFSSTPVQQTHIIHRPFSPTGRLSPVSYKQNFFAQKHESTQRHLSVFVDPCAPAPSSNNTMPAPTINRSRSPPLPLPLPIIQNQQFITNTNNSTTLPPISSISSISSSSSHANSISLPQSPVHSISSGTRSNSNRFHFSRNSSTMSSSISHQIRPSIFDLHQGTTNSSISAQNSIFSGSSVSSGGSISRNNSSISSLLNDDQRIVSSLSFSASGSVNNVGSIHNILSLPNSGSSLKTVTAMNSSSPSFERSATPEVNNNTETETEVDDKDKEKNKHKNIDKGNNERSNIENGKRSEEAVKT